MNLGERIDAWCKATDKSYQDLADACDITVAAVYQWVGTGRGRKKKQTKPELGHLEIVVGKVFGLSMEQFYGDVPAKARAS
jgi:hypothetical protein